MNKCAAKKWSLGSPRTFWGHLDTYQTFPLEKHNCVAPLHNCWQGLERMSDILRPPRKTHSGGIHALGGIDSSRSPWRSIEGVGILGTVIQVAVTVLSWGSVLTR